MVLVAIAAGDPTPHASSGDLGGLGDENDEEEELELEVSALPQ